MITLILGIVIFLQMIEYVVLADIILSWLVLAGFKIRPRFIANILDPIYIQVKKYIPTQIGPFDFTPLVVILLLILIRALILIAFPEVNIEINNLINR